MKDELIKVSIITPTFNSFQFIEETIKSIVNQSYTNWELLITDDCSTDGTWELITKLANFDDRIKPFRLEKNSGPGPARNNSIKFACGTYMTFIDSDDLWESDFLKTSLEFAEKIDASFVFSSYYRKNENLSVKFSDFIVPYRVSYNDVLKSCPISCLTAFINVGKVGKKYMPGLKKRQDAALWLSILREIDYAYGIPEPLATYRMRKNSLSRNKLKVIKYQWQLYRMSEKISVPKSLYFMFLWSYFGFIKYFNIRNNH